MPGQARTACVGRWGGVRVSERCCSLPPAQRFPEGGRQRAAKGISVVTGCESCLSPRLCCRLLCVCGRLHAPSNGQRWAERGLVALPLVKVGAPQSTHLSLQGWVQIG